MFYQLPNGRVIEISTEQYFEMSDEELEYLVAYNYGEIFENPWTGSILNNFKVPTDDEPEILPDLLNVPDIEKIIDLDLDDPSVLGED
jgi:hypothetical protein